MRKTLTKQINIIFICLHGRKELCLILRYIDDTEPIANDRFIFICLHGRKELCLILRYIDDTESITNYRLTYSMIHMADWQLRYMKNIRS